MDFFELMQREMPNISITENGAIGYKTTNKPLLDINFKVSSYRSDPTAAVVDFMRAYEEDKYLALAWLFFARDCRKGLGERGVFRKIIRYLLISGDPIVAKKILHLIPEYGRWDDLVCLVDTPNLDIKNQVLSILSEQFVKDMDNALADKPISLLAKWLPSVNTSSQKTKHLAKIIRKGFGLSEKKYRKSLAILRKYSNVVETKMSANNWGEIDYDAVPSKANLIYANAFEKHDYERRIKYLGAVERGEAKINASALYPYEIIHKYMSYNQYKVKDYDPALELLWEALPKNNEISNTLVVADGSGSMTSPINYPNVTTSLDVANSLAIYFSERNKGEFANKYITFSESPQFVDFTDACSLDEKINIALKYDEMANTNIEAVFDLILNTAFSNAMPQSELPERILIISDMEFDDCVESNSTTWGELPSTLFEDIADRYEAKGYKMPRLVFWNVCSRTKTIPIIENKLGVALISGFSPNIAKMVMSSKFDPYEILLETLLSDRYMPVIKAALS